MSEIEAKLHGTAAEIREQNHSEYTWPFLIEDYPQAVVRIASLRADRVHYLVFAWIELYPFDMTPPNSWNAGEKPWKVPGTKGWTCAFSATKLPTKDALTWYHNTTNGVVNIRLTDPRPVFAQETSLSPEPSKGRFSIGVEAPFVLPWHTGPRIHRLVPLKRVPRAICKLGKNQPARDWLQTNLGFDPFLFTEWLGSAALVAPNPLCCSVSTYLNGKSADGKETVSVRLVPRRTVYHTADLSTLTMHVIEQRLGAWTNVITFAGENLTNSSNKIVYPQSTGDIGYMLICSKRGLIGMMEPTPWLRQMHLNMAVGSGTAAIEVPSGGRRKPAQQYNVTIRAMETTSIIGEPMGAQAYERLNHLLFIRKKYEEIVNTKQHIFGAYASANPMEPEIKTARDEAQSVISKLVSQARKRLIFVDPFFGLREMRLFALRNQNSSVTPRILTGSATLRMPFELQSGVQIATGLVMLENLKDIRNKLNNSTPIVRVMPGRDTPHIHDRYLVIDDEVWHCGPSFNELGERLGVIVLLPNPKKIRQLIIKIWMKSQSLEEFISIEGSLK